MGGLQVNTPDYKSPIMQLLFQIEPRPENCDVSVVGSLGYNPNSLPTRTSGSASDY